MKSYAPFNGMPHLAYSLVLRLVLFTKCIFPMGVNSTVSERDCLAYLGRMLQKQGDLPSESFLRG